MAHDRCQIILPHPMRLIERTFYTLDYNSRTV
jgi:hypothetical protein